MILHRLSCFIADLARENRSSKICIWRCCNCNLPVGKFKEKFNRHISSILHDQIIVGVTSLWYNLQSQITWEIQRREEKSEKLQSFVDLGCGNGLLVHILQSEGVRFFNQILVNLEPEYSKLSKLTSILYCFFLQHPGLGLDVRKRNIWDLYGDQTKLKARININFGHDQTFHTQWLKKTITNTCFLYMGLSFLAHTCQLSHILWVTTANLDHYLAQLKWLSW